MQQKDFFEQLTNYSKNLKPLMAWNTLLCDMVESFSRQYMNSVTKVVNSNANYLRDLSTVTRVEQVAHLNGQAIKEIGTETLNLMHKSLEVIDTNVTAAGKLFQNLFEDLVTQTQACPSSVTAAATGKSGSASSKSA